jgi:hypothetical protein
MCVFDGSSHGRELCACGRMQRRRKEKSKVPIRRKEEKKKRRKETRGIWQGDQGGTSAHMTASHR